MKHDHGKPFNVVATSQRDTPMLIRLLRFVPNGLTLTAVVLGLTAIRLSGAGEFVLAMMAILGAALLDAADGFLARKLKAESAIGAELDSLADFLNFGVAPAMLFYDRHLYTLGVGGWLIAAVYVIATGLRLARFNVQAKAAAPLPAGERRESKKWFSGLPSTGAAIAMIMTDAIVLWLAPENIATVMGFAAITASALMVSHLRVPSLAAFIHACFRSTRSN